MPLVREFPGAADRRSDRRVVEPGDELIRGRVVCTRDASAHARRRVGAVLGAIGDTVRDELRSPVTFGQPLIGARDGRRTADDTALLPTLRIACRNRTLRIDMDTSGKLRPTPVLDRKERLDDQMGKVMDDMRGPGQASPPRSR